jgi:5-methylcytosine-specific restriction endonuclease McrA
MARPFEFLKPTVAEARLRQWGLCAHCGDSLDDVWENAHHVIPNQTGTPKQAASAFLRTADNCVILCESCHFAAHAHGNFRFGAVALADWYPFSHGKKARGQHLAWRNRIETEWRRHGAG